MEYAGCGRVRGPWMNRCEGLSRDELLFGEGQLHWRGAKAKLALAGSRDSAPSRDAEIVPHLDRRAPAVELLARSHFKDEIRKVSVSLITDATLLMQRCTAIYES